MKFRCASMVAILLATCVFSAVAADGGIRLRLRDPANESAVEVVPGAEALHLVLFATWCPPCEDELERLRELEARWNDRGYRLVLVAVQTRHTAERLKRYVTEESPPGTLLFDADGSAEAALAASELPTHVLLDSTGREVVRAGALAPEVEGAVERLLAGRGPGRGRAP